MEGYEPIFGEFDRKSAVEEAEIPSTVNMIGCSSLKKVILPKSLKGVGSCAFLNCTGIKKLTVKSDRVYIGRSAFSYNYEEDAKPSLQSIQFPKKFYGKLYPGSLDSYIGKKFIWINFLDTEDGFSDGFLSGAINLEEIRIPSRIKDAVIGMYAISSNKIDKVVVSAGVKEFAMFQQNRNLTKIIIKGKDTLVTRDNVMGSTDANYINSSTIIGPKGSKAERFTKNCYYPSNLREVLESDWDGDEEYTERNFNMKKVKFIGIKLPQKVKCMKTKKNLKWMKDKIAFGYKVYYSKSKRGTYKKISTIKKTIYNAKKKGYYKVKAYRIDYGEEWNGSFSKLKYIG